MSGNRSFHAQHPLHDLQRSPTSTTRRAPQSQDDEISQHEGDHLPNGDSKGPNWDANFEDVHSKVGFIELSTRVKQDLAACKVIATILKKYATIEDQHAKSLQRLAKFTREPRIQEDFAQPGFSKLLLITALALEESNTSHQAFSNHVHGLAREITEFSIRVDLQRKAVKRDGIAGETKVSTTDAAAEGAVNKYTTLRRELAIAIGVTNGQTVQRRRLVRPRKSGMELKRGEAELLAKKSEAENDMKQKNQRASDVRNEWINVLRPQIIQRFVDLAWETESNLCFFIEDFANIKKTLAQSQGKTASDANIAFSGITKQICEGDDFRDFVRRITRNGNNVPKSANTPETETFEGRQMSPAPQHSTPPSRSSSDTLPPTPSPKDSEEPITLRFRPAPVFGRYQRPRVQEPIQLPPASFNPPPTPPPEVVFPREAIPKFVPPTRFSPPGSSLDPLRFTPPSAAFVPPSSRLKAL